MTAPLPATGGNGPAARLDRVARDWSPVQRLHVGDVAWAHAGGDGSGSPARTLRWGEPLLGFADVWADGSAAVHLSPAMRPDHLGRAVDELLHAAPAATIEVSLGETALVEALTSRGLRTVDGPWFTRLRRPLDDLVERPLDGLAGPAIRSAPVFPARLPAGFVARAVRPGEVEQRAELHRRCWDPARIRRLLGLPVTGTEGASGYTADKHRAVQASAVHRPELDLVAVAPDGTFAAYALGWFDPVSRSVLFEPVGTAPEHAGRGLGRALCAVVLQVAARLGATQAIVNARGDAAYPIPRRLYTGLGMRPITRIVGLARP